MDARLDTCRRWISYRARRVGAGIFTDTYAPKERLLRRDRLIDTALATRPAAAEDRLAAG